MLPRLRAEEELGAFRAVAAGSGSMKKATLRSYLNQLGRDAGTRRAVRASLTDVRALGIRVKEVPCG